MSTTTMFSGKSKEDSYSNLTTKTAGSYYDGITASVLCYVRRRLEKRKNENQTVLALVTLGLLTELGVFLFLTKLLSGIGTQQIFLYGFTGLVEEEMNRHTDIIIYFEDQSRNDFNLLFKALEDKQDSSDPFSSTVYPVAIGRSMFSQCVPSNSLDILFSTAAVHWLSNPPIRVSNGLTYAHADGVELENIRETAKEDWNNFVVARGKELKPGACMVVHVGSFLPENDSINFFIGLSTAWQRAHEKKLINEREFAETTLNMYPARTLEEAILPFDQSRGQGLVLLSHEKKFHLLSGIVEKEKDRTAYADFFLEFMTPCVRNAIFCGLSDTRSLDEKNRVCDAYFNIVWDMAYKGEITGKYIPYFEIVAMKKYTD